MVGARFVDVSGDLGFAASLIRGPAWQVQGVLFRELGGHSSIFKINIR